MLCVVGALREAAAALCACVRLLARVAPPVLPQVRGGREALVALRALVRPFACVVQLCLVSADFCEKRRPHSVHAKGRSPVCMRTCLASVERRARRGRSPGSVWACRVRRCWRWRLARDLRGEGDRSAPDGETQEPETWAPPAAASPSLVC